MAAAQFLQKIFNYLIRTFYYHTITYIVNAPKEIVIEKLDMLFFERSGLFKSPNLSGSFVAYPYTFKLSPKWSSAIIENFETRSAYLKGIISETNDGSTLIRVSIRPNSVHGMLFLSFTIFGIYGLIVAFTTKGKHFGLYIGLFLLLIGLPMIIGTAKAAAHELQESFEKYLNVRPLKE